MPAKSKRDKILQAALDLFTDQGFHGAPIAEIAQKAKVGSGTIYRYFANKDDLIVGLSQIIHKRIRGHILLGYSLQKPVYERFQHLCSHLLRYFIAHPQEFRYVEQFHNSPYGISLRREQIQDSTQEDTPFLLLFEQAVQQQAIKDLPVSVLYALVFGPLICAARDHILGLVVLDEPTISQCVDACWDGVKISRPSG